MTENRRNFLRFCPSKYSLAIAGVSEVLEERRAGWHCIYVTSKMSSAVQSATLPFHDPKEAFLNIVRSGDNNLPAVSSQKTGGNTPRRLAARESKRGDPVG
jgi:hypothetical protein